MGNTFQALKETINPTQEFNMLMVGLDGAGKTTILYRLLEGEFWNTIPTIEKNVEEF